MEINFKRLCTASLATLLFLQLISLVSAVNSLPNTSTIGRISPTERERRWSEIGAGIRVKLGEFKKQLAKQNPSSTTRDLAYAALAELVLQDNPAEAEKMLRLLFSKQEMDPRFGSYGNIPWQIGTPSIEDRNSIEFATQTWGPLLLGYQNKLSPAIQRELRKHIKAAIVAIFNHRVPVSYTNIYLMKSVNLILMGEAIGDDKATAKGREMLDQWLDYTTKVGIHEFNSPTYYAVDLNCLGLGYRYTRIDTVREKLKASLDYFWVDIISNYFPGKERMAGPHSRDYDFLFGTGGLDYYLYLEGWRSQQETAKVDLEKIVMLEALSGDGYHPSEELFNQAWLGERIIKQRWDSNPGCDRYHYLNQYFSIGSVSNNYGREDKLITVEFASSKKLPAITIIADPFDDPYGKKKVKDRSGHNKPYHLPLSPTTVQEKGALLVLLDLDPSQFENFNGFATNIILPAEAEQLQVGEKALSITTPTEIQLTLDQTIGIREGKAGLAIRVFRADACRGKKLEIAIKADSSSLMWGAARLAVYHSRDQIKRLPDQHIKVGILFIADVINNQTEFNELINRVQTAVIDDMANQERWEVKVRLKELLLEAGRDLRNRKVLFRKVNGQEQYFERFSINGEIIEIIK